MLIQPVVTRQIASLIGYAIPFLVLHTALAGPESEMRKCAQLAIVLTSHRLGAPMSFRQVDDGLGTQEYVSFFEMRNYLEKNGFFCITKQYNNADDLNYLVNYLNAGVGAAILAYPNESDEKFHFVELLSINGNEIEILDSKYSKLKVAQLPMKGWPVMLITNDRSTLTLWRYVIPLQNSCLALASSLVVTILLAVSVVGAVLYSVQDVFCLKVLPVRKLSCRLFILLSVIILTIVFGQYFFSKNRSWGLLFETHHVDLGYVPIGSHKKLSIKLINNTEEEIDLKELVSSCDCVALEIEKYSVLPLSEANVLATFNVSQLGPFTNRILAIPKSSKIPSAEIMVSATGYQSERLYPSKIDLGVVGQSEVFTHTFSAEVIDYVGPELKYQKLEKMPGKWSELLDVVCINQTDSFENGRVFQFEISSTRMVHEFVFELNFAVYFGNGQSEKTFVIRVLGNTK